MVAFSSRQQLLEIEEQYQAATQILIKDANQAISLGKKSLMESLFMDDTYTISSHVRKNYYTVDHSSSGTAHLFGYSEDEFKNCLINKLMPRRIGEKHTKIVHDYLNSGSNKIEQMSARGFKVYAKSKEGSLFGIEMQLMIVYSINTPLSIAVILKSNKTGHENPMALLWPTGKLEGFNTGFGKLLQIPGEADSANEKKLFLMIPALLNIFFDTNSGKTQQESISEDDLNFDEEEELIEGEIDCFIFLISKI